MPAQPEPINPRQWLADEANRNLMPSQREFLNSVYDGSRRYGSLTPRQHRAVVRIMQNRGWQPVMPNDGVTILYTPPATPVSVVDDTPAEAADPSFVPNGTFRFRGRTFRVHTITRSRTASLVNKRVVEVFDALPRRWTTFGYLTRGATIKVWRRFADGDDGERPSFLTDGHDLFEILRLNEGRLRAGDNTIHLHSADEVIIDRVCIVCSAYPAVGGGYVRCITHRLLDGEPVIPPAPEPVRARRTVSAHPRQPASSVGARVGLVMSQINPRNIR